jgi:hypothetical protein
MTPCRICGEPIYFLGGMLLSQNGSNSAAILDKDGPHICKQAEVKVYTKEEIAEFEKQRNS